MAKYEAHITCSMKDAIRVEELGIFHGWKFSQIDGDALMESKPYCYLTGYARDGMVMHKNMQHITLQLEINEIAVLRSKIEHILYDTKTGINEL